MEKRNYMGAGVILLVLFAFFGDIPAGPFTHPPGAEDFPGTAVRYSPTPEPTRDATAHVTATPRPTWTPTVGATITATVTITPTPTPFPIGDPDPDAPGCVGHDVAVFHELWGPGCWYDHGHGVDPANTAFADVPGVHAIGGVWNTPGENEMPPGKHKGFVNLYEPGPNGDFGAWLCQVHTLGSNQAVKARYHSFACWMEVGGGFVFTAGISDYGILHSRYKQDWLPTVFDPGGAVFDNLKFHPPYRTGALLIDLPLINARQRNLQRWNAGIQPIVQGTYQEPRHNRTVTSLDFLTHDGWSVTDPEDPCWLLDDCLPEEIFIGGKFNGSLHRMYNFEIIIPELPDGTYFTDQYGVFQTDCAASSFECIPFVIEGAAPGTYSFDKGTGFPFFDPANPDNNWFDTDVCFIGAEVAPCYLDEAESVGRITYQGLSD